MKYVGHSWSKQALGYLADKNIISYFNKDNRYIDIVKYTWLSVDWRQKPHFPCYLTIIYILLPLC